MKKQQQSKSRIRVFFAVATTSSTLLWFFFCLTTMTNAQQPGDPNVDLETCVPVGTASQFEITLVNMGSAGNTNDQYVVALQKAADRWKKVIVNDLPNFRAGITPDWFSGAFDQPYNAAVDDVVIGYDVSSSIDGPGGTLGQAGPIFMRVRDGVATSTISGVMQFDVADLQLMPAEDFKAVALHEMGHVLGLVSINGACSAACNPNNSRQQGLYECPLARRIYSEYGDSAPDDSLFLENRGGIGTACGHWEEDSFRTGESSEIMTGYFEATKFQPVSRVTVAALAEIGGYEVDFCGADVWPADENTTKRYQVYRMQKTMNISSTMGGSPTITGMDDNGIEIVLFGGSAAATSRRVGVFLALLGGTLALAAGMF